MSTPMRRASDGDDVKCWLCDRLIDPEESSHSMLGEGVFLVHLRCYERELGGAPKRTQ